MIESISQISGSCLEQTTWLRRNLAVRDGDSNGAAPITPEISNIQSYSVQAQMVSNTMSWSSLTTDMTL